MWNPGTSYCECNKACTIDEYFDLIFEILISLKTSDW